MKNNTIIVTDAQGNEVARGTVPVVDGANTPLQVSEFMRERLAAWVPVGPVPDDQVEYIGEMRTEDGQQIPVATTRSRIR